jgi:hypothetical protein
VKRENVKRDGRLRWLACCAILLLATGRIARGAGYELSLEIADGKEKQMTSRRPAETGKPAEKRVMMEARTDAQFTAAWKVKRTGKDEAKDVLVHFYVVRIGRPGEAPPPLEPKRVVLESALTMDFPPGESTGAALKFRVDEPGVYLVRIETRPNADETGHEDFAAMDLVIK